MSRKIGVIGGSGIYDVEGAESLSEHNIDTPFGKTSDAIVEIEIGGHGFYFIPRHGKGHTLLPHEINYRANIFALKKLGVDYLISISAVGSLREELYPELLVFPEQLIDWTKGERERTFFGRGLVAHVSVANPISKELRAIISSACDESEVKYYDGGTGICIEGPQFSSRAESEVYRSLGASVIGMTALPEAYLAQEAGMAYAIIAMVTDYDCWKDEHCTVNEVMRVMENNKKTITKLLPVLLPKLSNNLFDFSKENSFAIMTARESMSKEQKDIVDILLR